MGRSGATSGYSDADVALTDRPPFSTALGLARYLTVCGLAGLIAGVVVGGVGGRLFMRIAGAAAGKRAAGATTEAGFTVGEITAGGTLGLVLFLGVFVGIAGAAVYVVLRPWLAWTGPWRGVVFGVVLFAVGSATSDLLNPDNIDFVILGNGPLLVSMIAALFVGFGALIDRLTGWLARRSPGTGRSHPLASITYATLAALGIVLGTSLLGMSMFTRSACDCDPPLVASTFLAIAACGTALWIVSAFSDSTRLPLVARALGLVGLAGAAAAGFVRAFNDAVEVLQG
jgi:hypothetical protein